MDQAGSRTQLPSVVVAVGTLLLVLFGTALLEDIPMPAIGTIVAVAVVPLLGIAEFRMLWRQDRGEFAVGAVCFLGALLLGPIPGIFLSFVLSLIVLASRAANPPVAVLSERGIETGLLNPATSEEPLTATGLAILRFAAPLFFANSAVLGDAARKAYADAGPDRLKHLVVDLEAVTDIDVTAAENLESLMGFLEEKQVTLGYSRARPEILDRLRHLGLLDDATHIYPTNRAALEALAPAPGGGV
jgi:MFS superfamily sulfate permease-like transporter